MAHADFVHLRVHSAYSLSAGAIKIKELYGLCKKQEMPAVAVTDTGNLFGALEFSVTMSGEGIQPIIGCELGIRAPAQEQGRQNKGLPDPEPVVLLCQSQQGYQNLIELVSKSFLETDGIEAPQVSLDDLAGLSGDLLCLTGGPMGPVGKRLIEGNAAAAEATLVRLKEIFPNRLYVELMRHDMADEDRIEGDLVDLAYAHDVPLVATNNVYFAHRDFYEAHDALLCIADGVTVNVDNRRRLTPEHHFKSAAEMRALFADLPEACDNTLVIARRCAFWVKKIKPILPPFPTESGRDEKAELRAMSHDGLTVRLERQVFPQLKPEDDRGAVEKRYRERLDFELAVIENMGFCGYFLIVADFIRWAKAQGIPVGPGRGSGAGSLVAWSCTITDLDPLALSLFFERFLNPERVSMPDFDVDFCQDRREEVIRYVQEKYGRDRVAQIITFGKLQARAVLRDVGRVLQMPYGQVDKISKLVPNNPANPVTLQQALDADEQLRALRDGDETVGRLIGLAIKLEGLYRHASTHAAGVVIGDRPLHKLLALYRDPRSDMPVTQFNMKFVEDAGLVKFDFLGLKTLTVIEQAVRLVHERGHGLDLLTIPLDDPATFEMLARGETVGVFQFEGAGMRDLLKKMRSNRFEDLLAAVSLYRPGPMDLIPEYIAVKHGQQEPDYMHPSLQGILEETYGIMIYQEQVMQIAQVMGGYTLGGADLLRRAMGKKIKAEMDNQRKMFCEGAVKNGVALELAEMIFDKMAKFAGYGFNKSHAAAYSLVAFHTAYLKAHFPVELMAASMTLDLGNTDKLNVFRQELQRMGVKLLPPDINRSEVEFSVEGKGEEAAIRYALAAVKGVGAEAMRAIVAERRRNGPFKSLFDFAERLETKQFNKRQFENLAKAGAFDSINPNRAQTFAAAELIMRHAATVAGERGTSQTNLFGGTTGLKHSSPPLPAVVEWPSMDRLGQEFEAIGFYLSAHPLDPYETALKRLGVVPSGRLVAHLMSGKPGRVRLAGIVGGRKERTSAKGNRFAFVSMSDLTGMYEIMLFSEILAQSRPLLDSGQPLLVTCDAKLEDDNVRLTAQSIETLDNAAAASSAGLRVVLKDPSGVEGLKALFLRDAGRGKTGKVKLVVPADRREVELTLPGFFPIGGETRSAVKAIPGVADVSDF
ncbi:DNA-directed DNA polymerase [Aliidongia dinghuensis]|uniref:DNA polymerase III subunit alpha n=1 Tax=Aliidongia dinghuensis TaxID=1867774 RepID=A0A8J2Z0P1_9PROT|nr:DNA polymerase III subunit alpha [Aliidongia dinghuensis]GGF40464.1 DNA-directed DNA polymerase [Aliidongia dinghuensis]